MVLPIGIALFIAGCFGLYWTGKRAFHRRNAAGIQVFSSYGGALVTGAFEGIIKIASWVSVFLGLMMFVASFFYGR